MTTLTLEAEVFITMPSDVPRMSRKWLDEQEMAFLSKYPYPDVYVKASKVHPDNDPEAHRLLVIFFVLGKIPTNKLQLPNDMAERIITEIYDTHPTERIKVSVDRAELRQVG